METLTIYSNEIKDRFEARYYINFNKINKILQENPTLSLNEISTLKGGYTPSHKHFQEEILEEEIYKESFPFIKSSNVKRGFSDLNNLSYIDKYAQKVLLKNSIIRNGDILIAMTGTVGAVALIPKNIKEGNISQNVVRIRIKKDFSKKIPKEYLIAILNSKFGQIQIQGLLTSTNQKYLNQIGIRKIKIPLLKNLYELADLYKEIYRMEHSSFEKINYAKQIFKNEIRIDYQNILNKKACVVNANDLTDFLTPKFYYPKYLNTLKQLKKKFKTVKLEEVADIKRGDEVGSENYKRYIDKKDSDVPFIRTSDLVNYEIDNYPDYYVDEEIYNELNQDIREGDILFTKDGKIGLTAMITNEDKFILASGIATIRTKKEIDHFYLFLVLSTKIGLYQALQRVVIASTIPHLRPERLAEIEIPLINPQKQKKISNLVKEAFQLKAEKKKLIREAITTVENLLK